MLLLPRCCRLASLTPPSLLPQNARRVTARRVAANTLPLQIRNARWKWVAPVVVCTRRAAKYVSACLRTYETPALEEAVGHLIHGTESAPQSVTRPPFHPPRQSRSPPSLLLVCAQTQQRARRLLRVRGIPEIEFRLRRSSQTGSLVEGRAT